MHLIYNNTYILPKTII